MRVCSTSAVPIFNEKKCKFERISRASNGPRVGSRRCFCTCLAGNDLKKRMDTTKRVLVRRFFARY